MRITYVAVVLVRLAIHAEMRQTACDIGDHVNFDCGFPLPVRRQIAGSEDAAPPLWRQIAGREDAAPPMHEVLQVPLKFA